jgi:hypothetical protein
LCAPRARTHGRDSSNLNLWAGRLVLPAKRSVVLIHSIGHMRGTGFSSPRISLRQTTVLRCSRKATGTVQISTAMPRPTERRCREHSPAPRRLARGERALQRRRLREDGSECRRAGFRAVRLARARR